jgi:uncharacterized caspase-like protein
MLRLFTFVVAGVIGFPALADERVALVIGNARYAHVPQLDNPVNDAKLMAQTLKDLGFTLVGDGPLLDLDKAGFDEAVQSFGRKAQGADVALFYYAGHGVQVRGGNYLVPVNANPTREADVDFQMLDAGLVLRQMEGSGTRLNLVMLDACRNNPFGGRGLRSGGSGLAQMQAPEGTLISYATQPGNVAQDGTDGNSPYTRALAATIKSAGLDIFQTFNEVGRTVKRATGNAQQPWLASSPIEGNFYFAPLAPSASPAAVEPKNAATLSTGSAPDSAADAWDEAKDTKSATVLKKLIELHPNTLYAELARERLEQLEVAQAPPSPPPSPPAVAETTLARLPEPEPQDAPRPRGRRENCSRSGATLYCASSVLPAAHGNNYGARNLTDGNSNTAWVEGSGGQGTGDFVVLEFDAPRTVSAIDIRNGYDKNADIYGKNSRVKDVEIRFSNGESIDATLADSSAEQTVRLSRPIEAKWVQIVIRSVYPGWKYTDTAINELRVR